MLLILACAGSGSVLEPDPAGGYRVLFIGNSLTYFNDLPGTVARLGSMADVVIHVESVALPNFAVIDHASGMSNAVETIRSGKWDYVVLQQGPTTTEIGRDTLLLAVRQLDPIIRGAGGRPALLMVWPPSGNLEAFDAVHQSYQQSGNAVGGLFLPAGDAWRTVLVSNPDLPLYGIDGYPPAELGTYLTALVVYEGITGRDARSLPRQAVVASHPLVRGGCDHSVVATSGSRNRGSGCRSRHHALRPIRQPRCYGVAGGGGASTAAMRSSTSERSCSQTFGALSLISSGATQRLVVATCACWSLPLSWSATVTRHLADDPNTALELG